MHIQAGPMHTVRNADKMEMNRPKLIVKYTVLLIE